MFDQMVECSEATRQANERAIRTLRPALSGCARCGTVQMIAGPSLGTCSDCGAVLAIMTADGLGRSAA
jgi:hypothetical protein